MKDILHVAVGAEAHDGEPGSLGLPADQGQMLADEGVEQGRLADVGLAGEGDVAGAAHVSYGAAAGVTRSITTPWGWTVALKRPLCTPRSACAHKSRTFAG